MEVIEMGKRIDANSNPANNGGVSSGSIRAMLENGKVTSRRHYPRGLDHRQRDRDGEIRHKRSDTLVGTLRKTYGDEFAEGYRSDTRLGTVLKKEGVAPASASSTAHRFMRCTHFSD